MIKFSSLFSLLFVSFYLSGYGQINIQIFHEDFNGGTSNFTLNSFGPFTSKGNNKWIINNQYNGNGTYPNTPDQNQVVSGQIAGAPKSNYLHIHNSLVAPGTSNANYNTSNTSDNFAEMSTDYCTLGLGNVRLTFFYIAVGAPNDFGELYYSIDGGFNWIKTGQTQYSSTPKWKSVIVADPAFADKDNLRFGWRWKNSGAGTANTVSFGIDDIFLDGTYDNVNKPPDFMQVIVIPNTVCQAEFINVSFGLADQLCSGGYDIEIANTSGSAWTLIGNAFLLDGDYSGSANDLALPPTLTPGFYKIRVTRSINPPLGITAVSDSFQIIACPHEIRTLKPAVTNGPDTLCVNSVIDVPFISKGYYALSNNYIAELSDASGSFSNPNSPPQRIGVLSGPPAQIAYDPDHSIPPGNVAGLVPEVPAGCNYYIRVRSSTPSVIPDPSGYFGPFCLKHCDIETNQTKDVQVCISDTRGDSSQSIIIDKNIFDNIANYLPGNQFKVQIIPMKYDSILNTGGLGTVTAVNDTLMTLNVPNFFDLNLFGMKNTTYYMRIIATNSNKPWDTLGTLVRLSIGKTFPPGNIKPIHIDDFSRTDSTYCRKDFVVLVVEPDHTFPDGSTYEWYSPIFGNQKLPNASELDFRPPAFLVPGTWVRVREWNNGCASNWSDTIYLKFIDPPSAKIKGPVQACVGDTLHFSTPFLEETSYHWSVFPDSSIIDTSNNEITVVFKYASQGQIDLFALNQCGPATSKPYKVTVNALPSANFAGVVAEASDTTICARQDLTLATTNPQSGDIYIWKQSGTTISTDPSVTVAPNSTTQFTVEVTSLIGCKNKDTLDVNVIPSPSVVVTAQDISCFGNCDGTATALYSGGTPPLIFSWSNTQTAPSISNLCSGNYRALVSDINDCYDDTTVYINEPGQIKIDFVTVNVSYNSNDGSATAVVGAGTQPYSYLWSTVPVQSRETAQALSIGSYTVTVTDARGCSQEATVSIYNRENSIYVPNAFSPNGDGLNDVFDFYATNLKEFYLAIYNRWGELVFESASPGKKWDGNYKNKSEQVGAYAYYINATFLDGTKQIKKGNVTLMK